MFGGTFGPEELTVWTADLNPQLQEHLCCPYDNIVMCCAMFCTPKKRLRGEEGAETRRNGIKRGELFKEWVRAWRVGRGG
jgi:hypothetical protein